MNLKIILSFRNLVMLVMTFAFYRIGPISPRNAARPHNCYPHLMTEVKNIILCFRYFVVPAQYFKALMEGGHSTTVGEGCRPNVLEKFWPSLTILTYNGRVSSHLTPEACSAHVRHLSFTILWTATALSVEEGG
jgi:hypothetical protein